MLGGVWPSHGRGNRQLIKVLKKGHKSSGTDKNVALCKYECV